MIGKGAGCVALGGRVGEGSFEEIVFSWRFEE